MNWLAGIAALLCIAALIGLELAYRLLRGAPFEDPDGFRGNLGVRRRTHPRRPD
jgi:hypothetical protein